jgi:hypothetical protein
MFAEFPTECLVPIFDDGEHQLATSILWSG